MESATPTPTGSRTAALAAKLNEVAKAIPFVEKRGRNEKQSYNFAQATDVLRDVRAQLQARGIIVLPGAVPGSVRHVEPGERGTGGRSFVTTVDLYYRFIDCETGAQLEVPWVGAGADLGGEKGLYKAMTGALKYVLLQTFLLPTSDDPEHDALTQPNAPAPPPAQDRSKDAERPAAPRIPLDRARLLAERAVEVGLADSDDNGFVMGPVIRAKLADLGAEKIGALDVDQAEALEAFLAQEAKDAADEAAASQEPQS